MKKPRVALLNPPGSQLYVRDYYCSKVSKGDYLYHPIDLLILSGWLHQDFEILVLDCIVEKLSPKESLSRLAAFDPAAVIFVTGSASKHEDYPFLQMLKSTFPHLLVGTGDCLLEAAQKIKSEAPWLDAVIYDFSSKDTVQFLRNHFFGESNPVADVGDLRNSDVSKVTRLKGALADIPVPRYELFPNHLYTYPFVRRSPFATVLTDYGCPFRCEFCIQSTIGFKLRSVENVVEELDYVHSLGFRDIYFADQTFGYKRRRLKELCEAMIERRYNFDWVAFTRADVVDEETLRLMKRSGCHLLMFGVESPIQSILDQSKKDITLEQIRAAFLACHRVGIKTLATFIIGLPGTSYEDNLKILDFAIELDADYASFNVLIPRIGTIIRDVAQSGGWIENDDGCMDQSGTSCVMGNGVLTSEQLFALRKVITRGFYFRPRYILKRALALRTRYECARAIKNAIGLARHLFSPPRSTAPTEPIMKSS